MGRKWFRGRRGVYVPDQQGCLEMERGLGGTLSVPVGDPGSSEEKAERFYNEHGYGTQDKGRCGVNAALEDGHQIPESAEEAAYCRLGVAKQKGKLRVVTMQASIMKDVLRPVHESAYNRLCKHPWLVRGDVKKAHFESLRSASSGLDFISGDYAASTDNLNCDAVLAVVETLAESLPPRESELFVRSFRDCHVVEGKDRYPVVRGSMMGNLGSFVVLCILNRICFERAVRLAGYDRHHPSILNGDDILFPGESGLYYSWLHCTSEVGFVINRSKTMRNRKYGDLNSQTYNFSKSRMVPKLCFGFLGSDSWKEPVGSLASPLFDLCRQIKFSTATWLLVAFPIRKLLARVPIPLSSFPSRWWNFLVKKNWFRGLIDLAEEPTPKVTGFTRAVPFSIGPPIHTTPYREARIREFSDRVITSFVNAWQGIPLPPAKTKIKHRTFRKLRSKFRLARKVSHWSRLWVTPVLEYLKDNHPEIFIVGSPKWVDDQPNLERQWSLVRSPIRRALSFAPLIDEFIPFYSSAQGKVFVAC
ncbi:RNA dependent RNA polymerase [Plasmopara viticola lesion associated ourmia-like virus 55]|uniref:RNA dependent RNA polymerase n=1 Tax=Plasmopara viticola lesion associated ourmia-like virus 55 TaxID=2686526 RepID=A0ABX6FIY9_9VIRU|nr:RNA dependent RNA polymerase [Plasmopara viticola lesion associated ourmia-like virus 55]QGY72585.1 RNA dependent RNA polymerase [Plasmopara viticola lesion associated ourmia-like virus 55]